MRTVIWSHAARRDLFQIADYYGSMDPDLPKRMLDRIQNAPLALIEHPHLGALTSHREIRKWRVKQTPFLLFYLSTADFIEIWRVVHAAMDWRNLPQ